MKLEFFLLEEADYPIFEHLYRGSLAQVGDDCLLYGAVADGEPAALLVLEFLTESEAFWLTWLYVDPKMRRKEIGSGLLFYVIQKVKKNVMVDSLQAPVATEELKDFFSAVGFEISDLPHCHVYEGKLSELTQLAEHKAKGVGKQIIDITAEEQKQIESDLEQDPNAFVYRFDPKSCLPESRYIRNKDGLQAMLLLQEDEDALVIPYAYAKSGNGAALFSLLVEAEKTIRERMKPDTLIRLTTVNEKAESLVEKLLPEAVKKPVFLAEEDLLLI